MPNALVHSEAATKNKRKDDENILETDVDKQRGTYEQWHKLKVFIFLNIPGW
jgi:hypothetical protein